MKAQRVNPNNMNPMQMNSMSSMMGMMNTIQKIGKGKRKYVVKLDKNSKKFLSKFVDEVKKQFGANMNGQNQGLVEFFDYIKMVADDKNKMELRLSFEEMEFLKRMVSDSIKGMEAMQFKWYQIIRKTMIKLLVKQYRELLTRIN
ncbi:MAG: hypothetical protein RR191_04285 [Cetobacterium sp.]|uniref:hypothetical protein n=1 Tax=unclassified Cetobacterium TaxID=2630983 RepID=UPI00163B84A3|nr:hypothetical protein [Cetobacterium sp. 2A]MBC2856006.1 hypothetical protein [Cetobacterium sp. 2A]